MTLTLLVCALIAALGAFTDHVLKDREKSALRNRANDLAKRIASSTYGQNIHDIAEGFERFRISRLGPNITSATTLCVLFVLSSLLTSATIHTANLAIYYPEYFEERWTGLGVWVIIIAAFFAPLSETKTIYIVLFTISAFRYFVTPIIFFYWPTSIYWEFVEPLSSLEHYLSRMANVVINFVFDFATLAVTCLVIRKVAVANFSNSLMLIILDLIAAICLAALSAYCIMFAQGEIYGVSKLSIKEALEITINCFLLLDPDLSKLRELAYASTTLIPTLVVIATVLICQLFKIVSHSVRLSTGYVLEARLEQEDMKLFTVLGLVFSILAILVKIGVELSK